MVEPDGSHPVMLTHHNGFRRYLPTPHFLTKKSTSFEVLYCQKWWWKMVISMIFFYAQKMRNLQFSSSKISNSAHPVQKIQCLLNGKKWQSLPEYGNKWQWFFCIFPMRFSFPENNRFFAKIITIVTIFYHFITKTAFQFSNNLL